MIEIFFQKIAQQSKSLLPLLVKIYLPPLCFLAVLFFIDISGPQGKVFLGQIMKDPVAILRGPFYTGFVSNIGILFWCSTAAICLFASSALREPSMKNDWASFFLYAGLLTAILCLDDLFLFHESVGPTYFHIPEQVTYIFYFGALVYFFLKYQTLLMKTDYLILFLALVFFGLSLLVDFTIGYLSGKIRGIHIFEDAFKLLGIVGWFAYFTRTCRERAGSRAPWMED